MDGHGREKVAIRPGDSPCFCHAGAPLSQPLSNIDAGPAGLPQPGAWRIASWGLASTLAATGLSYAFQILVARFMSPRSYGETVAMLSLYMVCTLPLAPVFLLVTQRVVDARLRGAGGDIRTLLATLARVIVAASAAAVAVITLGRDAFAGWLHVAEPMAAPAFALSVGASAVYLLAVAVLLGRMNWFMANLLPVLLGAGRIIFSLILVRPGFEVSGTFVAITASALLCLSIGIVAARQGLPAGGRYHALHVREVALAIVLTGAFWFLVQVDTLYVNHTMPDLAGRYAAASMLGKMLVYVPVAVGTILFPLLTGAGDASASRRVLRRMLGVAALLAAAGWIPLAAAPTLVLRLTLGPLHLDAAEYLAAVGAVMAPFALVSVFLYDALARQDRVLTAVFAATASAAALVLAIAPPSITALFVTLLCGAAVTSAAGVLRMTAGRSSEPVRAARP